MLTGLLFLNSDIQRSILLFNGHTRWPRNLRVVLHDCSIHHFHIFPSIKNIIPPYVFKSEGNDAYFYTLQIPHLSFEIRPDSAEVERHIRLLREMDKRKLFWPYPLQQLQWLKGLLDRYPLDNDGDPGRITRMNAKGEQSLRQAIRRYFHDDLVRKLIPQWEPTGVFFERVELNWRDCFFLALATAKWQLLGKPPPPIGMNKLVLDCVANKEESQFAGESVLEKKGFEHGLARLQPDGASHYKVV
ncbi:hypothetical protein RvY_10422-2 [Ramazzottius varieornatus]|uniref:Uncharacterized protein n=1 Tax=Ramazzottius varieornatus TaxID=947166 RepID=A0A1D1VH62_RAMVA|nr:hypothetical protein RvY_10422-2 [Ramazzottius varieornatus]